MGLQKKQMVIGPKKQSLLLLKVTTCELDDTKESPVLAGSLLSFYSQKKEVGYISSHICLMNIFLIECKDQTVASNLLQHFCKATSARLIIKNGALKKIWKSYPAKKNYYSVKCKQVHQPNQEHMLLPNVTMSNENSESPNRIQDLVCSYLAKISKQKYHSARQLEN